MWGGGGGQRDLYSCASFSRKKKKILKEQRKQRERVELKMDLPGVSIADDGDTSMFSLRTIQRTPVCGAE